jgi:hypothetical protein
MKPSYTFPQTFRDATLAGCGVVCKACRLAFSYGTESDPTIAASVLAKLTRTIPHTYGSPPPSSYNTAFVPIIVKGVTDAFTCMPKKSAFHKNLWTWRLFRDMANRPKTADLLRSFIELFVNGKLLKPMWKFLSTAIVIPFHKIVQIERALLKDPRLRPITIGALLCGILVRVVLRMKRKCIANRLLPTRQFSYGIPRGVQMVIACARPRWSASRTFASFK